MTEGAVTRNIRLSACMNQMLGVCMTCMAMYLNGVLIELRGQGELFVDHIALATGQILHSIVNQVRFPILLVRILGMIT